MNDGKTIEPPAASILPSSLPLAGLALLVFAAAVRAIDHDESQYVAAVALMRHGLPFRDFLYLQTPLQPLLLAPLGWIGRLPLLPLLRGVNAVAGLIAAIAVARSARAIGSDRRSAWAAALLMLCCDALLFACAVARNDAIPLMFEAIGIGLLLRALIGNGRGWSLFGAGLCFGAAASTKISYAIPAAAAALHLLLRWREDGARRAAPFLLGVLVGLAPSIWMAVHYPEAFRFGVFEYGLRAPRQWSIFSGYRRSPLKRITRVLLFFAQGPAPVALALVLRNRRQTSADGLETRRLLDLLIVAGVVAALLPQPTYRQYLLPILPPLFVCLGAMRLGTLGQGWRAAFGFGVLAGLAQTAIDASTAIRQGSPPLLVAREAMWIGARTAGPVATLSPEWVAGGGAALDPRFAAGPFVFRTDRMLSPEQERRFHAVTLRGLTASFAQAPPAAIVVGQEAVPYPAHPGGLDAPLAEWARGHGYRAEPSRSGSLTLYRPDIPLS